MCGTCNTDQMEQRQCRKPTSLRLICTEFSVNGEDTKSKLKKMSKPEYKSEQGKAAPVLVSSQSTEPLWECEGSFSAGGEVSQTLDPEHSVV